MSVMSVLDREHTVAPHTYNRWLIPPAALAVHLCIGQAYATSVYKNSMVDHFGASQTAIGFVFSIAIVMLGLSAAVFGTWVDRVGPRKAMFTAACCWAAGFLVGAAGIATGQLWLLYLGYGVIGGIGLGIGYISPVSTLIKWFPDRPGLATGMAIMGFGGGAMVAAPASRQLMGFYDSGYDPADAASLADGGALTGLFVSLGIIYFVIMMIGVANIRVPPTGWVPEGFDPAQVKEQEAGHRQRRVGGQRDPDPAVLAALDRAVLQRDRRHRHPRAGGPDDPGLLPRRRGRRLQRHRRGRRRLRRAAVAVQHGRPLRVVQHVGLHRAQADLHDLPRRRDDALRAAGPHRLGGHRALRADRGDHHLLLRRRLRDRAGLPARPVRGLPGRRDPRPAADGLGRGRASRARSSSTGSSTVPAARAR